MTQQERGNGAMGPGERREGAEAANEKPSSNVGKPIENRDGGQKGGKAGGGGGADSSGVPRNGALGAERSKNEEDARRGV